MNPNKISIKINDQEIGFKFGMGYLGRMIKTLGRPVDEFGEAIEENPFLVIPEMMFQAYKYNQEREKLPVEFEVGDFIDWIDQDGGFNGHIMQTFLKGWRASINKDVPKVNEAKKKVAKQAVQS